MVRAVGVGSEDTHPADEGGHFRGCQRHELRLVDQQRLGRDGVTALEVVAETIGVWLKNGERFGIRLFLSGVRAAWGERHNDVVPGFLGGLFHGGTTGQHDEIREGNFFRA